MVLEKNLNPYKRGDKVDTEALNYMKTRKVPSVSVFAQEIDSVPEITGIRKIPTISDDWIEKLVFENLKKSLVESAETGAKTDIHGYKPYPAITFGAEFGKGERGKY